MFTSVLVANRGEIAVRIIRTLRTLGIHSIAVYSDADADARHVGEADESLRIGPSAARESYLSIDRIIDAAVRTGAQALHPGYGFLSENAELAEACERAGIVFIGPKAASIHTMGDKIEAKQTVAKSGVPVVPGIDGRGTSDAELIGAARELGFPILIKPSAGGGGKGMRLVHTAKDLAKELAAARREALAAFNDDALLLEHYVHAPRHIEIQIAADQHGNVVHFGERECSLQRRHQKIIEEAPSPFVTPEMRAEMGRQAIAAAVACAYTNVGTVEFIVPGNADGAFYFMEMNTRLQVEHPVTEAVYGIDLVEWQLRIAAGEPLPLTQDQIQPRGHAIEARIYAEDPASGFLPTGGTIVGLREPIGIDTRIDSGLRVGTTIGSSYDPLLAKVIAWGENRHDAMQRLDQALADTTVLGVITNVSHLRTVLRDPAVVAGNLSTHLVEALPPFVRATIPDAAIAAAALFHLTIGDRRSAWSASFGWRHGGAAPAIIYLQTDGATPLTVAVHATNQGTTVKIDSGAWLTASLRQESGVFVGHVGDASYRFDVALDALDGETLWLGHGGETWTVRRVAHPRRARIADAVVAGPITSPMPGTLQTVHVSDGDHVVAGQALAVVEAMKMEHTVVAPANGIVVRVLGHAGQQVRLNETLMLFELVAEEAHP